MITWLLHLRSIPNTREENKKRKTSRPGKLSSLSLHPCHYQPLILAIFSSCRLWTNVSQLKRSPTDRIPGICFTTFVFANRKVCHGTLQHRCRIGSTLIKQLTINCPLSLTQKQYFLVLPVYFKRISTQYLKITSTVSNRTSIINITGSTSN